MVNGKVLLKLKDKEKQLERINEAINLFVSFDGTLDFEKKNGELILINNGDLKSLYKRKEDLRKEIKDLKNK